MTDIVERLRKMRNDTACYPEVCDDAMGEILYLRLQLAQAMKERSRAIAVGDDLEQEVERLRLDAARYRWLRSQTLDDPEIWIAVDSAKHPSRWGLGGDDPDGCDAAIDAAMKL